MAQGAKDISAERTMEAILDDGVIVAVRLGADVPLLDICRAIARGGLRVLEITLTTPGALEAIRTLTRDETLTVGAGTVLTPADVSNVADAGGRFVLSPVFHPGVMNEAVRRNLAAIPGAATPLEIQTAFRHGAKAVKFFPAAALGGPAFIKAFRGPFPDIPLIPTSGPSIDSIASYLSAGAVAVGVGAELFRPGFTLESLEETARRTREAFDRARLSG